MGKDTKVKTFRRLYAEAHLLLIDSELNPENPHRENIDKAIVNIDKMISMLPMKFPTTSKQYSTRKVLLINMKDGEDEPEEIVEIDGPLTRYSVPKHTATLYESTALKVLEDWKFVLWNALAYYSKDPAAIAFYKSLAVRQAKKCVATFPDKDYWEVWEKRMFVMYTNQIAWYAYTDEEDPVKLNEALEYAKRGLMLSNWHEFKYIKDTIVRLLIKSGKEEEAFPIVREAFEEDEDYEDFRDMKTNEKYLQWKEKDDERIATEKKREEEMRKAFQKMVRAEKKKIKDQFNYPDHPLVKQYADLLNLIKLRMLDIKLDDQYSDSKLEKPDQEDDSDYVLTTWSPEKIAAHEKEQGYHLPDQLKAYLLEIGEGGDVYFCYDGFFVSSDDKYKKRFPITAQKMHPIGHYWKIDAWVYPDDEDLMDEDILDESADPAAMFGLPEGAEITDGCMFIGNSNSQDELFLILNGEFEGEVWVDTLQYGVEARGCFAQASAKKLHFLPFIAESLLAKYKGYENASGKGAWL